ncbi:MAG: hypothetical protein J6B68_13255 [Lachnospiraceae bacterium]|nr:hypothetical protein [Lachnospiraceae bacterium]
MIFQEILTAIPTEEVQEKTFFMEALTAPYIIWGIRIVCIVAAISALIIYIKMKRKKGE